ncbi:Cell surface glycoprotein CD200 receptor 1 [Cricetulus griseus]|uniref:Cell surface glycoprotein CD200 receptor 1 n=1 Tax=Cricetulus griseus TaxID=10029 RepID=G3H094_CRIGR|nr:Cell surface glycoprotein CD200 receptor 1 [Cricetulus griseus]
MPCFWRTSDLAVLLTWGIFVVGEKRAAVCEAIAGKPAAQISWTPDGYHVTKNESHSNGTVTVRSTYHGEHSNVSAVFCFVSHPTGNQTLSTELNKGVPPEVTLIPGEKRAAVCEAIAGKPAAQISWTPDGYHVTKNESHSNGTVTVRSTYHGEHSNVSAVFCFVSHPTGNQTLSIELNQGEYLLLFKRRNH